MANADYVVRGEPASLCPVAELAGSIAPLETQVYVTGFKSPGAGSVQPGMAIMIGGEICKLVAKTGNHLEIRRGCADTIPRAHAAGTLVWFLGLAAASDGQEWGGSQTVAVKLLPATSSGGSVPLGGSPPNDLTFAYRFIRPYPPGALRANAVPWLTGDFQIDEITDLALTWAHRDRIGQADQLVSHDAASVGPEAGTTYKATIYRADDLELASYESIVGTAWTYTHEAAEEDFTGLGVLPSGYMIFRSVRDGYESRDAYRIDFSVVRGVDDLPRGLGYRLGESLGGPQL